MANLKDIAVELATTSLVIDLASEHKENLRGLITELFGELGSDSVKVTVDDERIGKISLVEPKPKPFVSDESALLHWVVMERPDEIIQQIRESFKKYLLDNCEVLDDGTCVLATTGEIIPGISARKANPYVSTRFESDGRERLAKAIQQGRVAFNLPSTKINTIEGSK
jgi:hypothetical protein